MLPNCSTWTLSSSFVRTSRIRARLDVSQESLEESDEFDIAYERARENEMKMPGDGTADCGCKITEDSEPGDDRHAPYFHEHQIAAGFERMLAALLGVDWEAYCQANIDAAAGA